MSMAIGIGNSKRMSGNGSVRQKRSSTSSNAEVALQPRGVTSTTSKVSDDGDSSDDMVAINENGAEDIEKSNLKSMTDAEREEADAIEDFRAKRSSSLLNIGVVAALLAAFGFDAFESQAQISAGGSHEGEAQSLWSTEFFAIVCLLTLSLNMASIVLSVYLYEVLNDVKRQNVVEWLHRFNFVLKLPSLFAALGLFCLALAVVIQSHIDYDLHQPGIAIFAVMFGVLILLISWVSANTRKMRRRTAVE